MRRAALLVFVTTLVALAPAFRAGFLWCDDYTVVDNPLLGSVAGLRAIWAGGSTEQYYPVTSTLTWVLVRAGGPAPALLHAVCLLLHAGAAALLFAVGCRVLRPAAACLGALLFGVHPLCVESAAWIYELKTPLATVFLLVAALAWWRGERAARPGRWRLLATLLFILGLLSKSMVLVLPFLLAWCILFDVPPGTAPRGVRLRRLVPLMVLGAVSAAVTLVYERVVNQATGPTTPVTLLERLGVAGRVFWFQVGRFLLPLRLAFAYPRFVLPDSPALLLLPTALALLLPAGLVLLRRRAPRPAVRGLLLFVGLAGLVTLPVSGLSPIYMHRYTWVADHLAYPLVMVLAPGIGLLVHRAVRTGFVPVAAVLVLVSGGLTFHRATRFRSAEALWRDSLAVGPSWLAHAQLALLARERGDVESMIEHDEASLAIEESVDAHVNLANALLSQDRTLEALVHYAAARALGGVAPEAELSHAAALASVGLLDDARAIYAALLAAPEPDSPAAPDGPAGGSVQDLARQNLAGLDAMIQQIDAERTRLEALLAARPEQAGGWRRLAEVCLARGRFAQAADAWRNEHEFAPDDPEPVLHLAWVHALGPDPELRDVGEARRWAAILEERSGSEDPRAMEILAAVAALTGDAERAVELLDRALRLVEESPGLGALRPRLEADRERYRRGLPPWSL